MVYRVILLRNGKYKQTLHRCRTKDTSIINYQIIKKANENIIFPRRFINSNGIKPVTYEICVVKDFEDGDGVRTLRDDYGRTYKEKVLFNKWTVLASQEYFYEETFWVYGDDPIHERKTILELMPRIMNGANKHRYTKQLIVVHNKLVIHNEDEFIMIICKNKEDAQRLHHTLHKAAKKNKIKMLVFMGTASPATVSRMYELILDKTDWSIEKIRRTSTKP
jgi:hypothetical protein